MTERLSDLRARLGATRQLEAVITAMRGVAAARLREAQTHLEGVRAYAHTLGEALGEAMALQADARAERSRPDGHVVIALCAEQGFAGAFSERVLDAAQRRLAAAGPGASLFLVGGRGQTIAEERGLRLDWAAPMAAHVDEAAGLADHVADALYDLLGTERTAEVTMVHSAPDERGVTLVERPLIPLDLARFPASRRSVPPLTTLPPALLLARLAEEYVFAELCEAIVLSFAAENEARLQAMIAARQNVRETLDALMASYRRVRQDEITNEIIELAAR
ncbi:MAG: H(+)-transporting ATPase [Methylocystaceae bacterium]|nr:MAG: H(+)-transporting ATPase [Methylocystaceae bacterium]